MIGSAASQPRYFFFCSSVPAELDRRQRERVRGDARLDAAAAVRELLGDERASMSPRPGPPYSAGIVGFTRPISWASFEDVLRELRLAIALGGDRDDALAREAPRGLDEGLLLLGRLEIEHGCSSLASSLARPPPGGLELRPSRRGAPRM